MSDGVQVFEGDGVADDEREVRKPPAHGAPRRGLKMRWTMDAEQDFKQHDIEAELMKAVEEEILRDLAAMGRKP